MMIDLKYLQNNFQEAQAKLQKKHVSDEIIEALHNAFIEQKQANATLEEAKANQNQLSKLFGQYKREKKDTTELKLQVDANKELIASLQEIASKASEALEKVALSTPNFPHESVPYGEDENDNVEIKKVLTPRVFDFEPKEHWDLGTLNNWIDFERGVKLAKSRFSVIRGMGAKVERALINFFLDENASKGFEEFCVPFINNATMLQGTGQLPKFEDDLFKIDGEDLYLIPTAEVPLTNFYHDEILSAKELPFCLQVIPMF